jgi:glycerol-3-phosphate cytidylyltransferase
MSQESERIVITYGTFDLFHIGHLRLLKRAASLGTKLIVGLSSDEFNTQQKQKNTAVNYEHRREILESLSFVDLVIPENSWDQKPRDVLEHKVSVFVMGSDWAGKFDELSSLCEVVYLPRTEGVSTTDLKIRSAQIVRDADARSA